MSRKTVSAVIGSILMVGFALGAVQGCGSSSSGSYAETCMQGCAKILPCEADAGFTETMAQCVQGCTQSAMTSSGGACKNAAAMQQAANACLTKTTCTDLLACGATIPQCETSGTGGTTGATGGTSGATGGTSGATGGSSGATGGTSGATGGSSGTNPSCSICDKAQACCTAIEGAAACTAVTAATCNSTPAANQATIITDCQTILTAGASLNAACK